MTRHILGLDDPRIILPKSDVRKPLYGGCNFSPDAFAFPHFWFFGYGAPCFTDRIFGSYERCVYIYENLYDIDVLVKWSNDEAQHHHIDWNDVINRVKIVILFSYMSELEQNDTTDIYSDSAGGWLAQIKSNIVTRCSNHRRNLLISYPSDNLWSFYPSRSEASEHHGPDIEETDLEGIDGYVVANGVTARIVIKQSLTDAEKKQGVQCLLERSQHGRKVGVFLWCLDEGEAENEPSTLNETK